MQRNATKYTIGIDEAGRGPLAGPVAVGAVAVRSDFDMKLLKGVQSSKRIREKEREAWSTVAANLQKEGVLNYRVALVGERFIDTHGIAKAVHIGIHRVLTRLRVDPCMCRVLLDGAIKAPVQFEDQTTIIRGDESEPLISLASIVAKVRRDRRLIRCAKQFPEYGFEQHKGYGTKEHYENIKEHGMCELHRRSFVHI